VPERQRTRQVGRVNLLEMTAGASAEPLNATPPAGYVLDVHRSGQSAIVNLKATHGAAVGSMRIAAMEHRDAIYGRLSEPDGIYAYAYQLEVAPSARGRGAGTLIVRACRQVAADYWALGFRSLVSPANAASVYCHTRAGVNVVAYHNGIRVGRRIHWLRHQPKPIEGPCEP
jgi:GNAT superfamily N-acetyltransferase